MLLLFVCDDLRRRYIRFPQKRSTSRIVNYPCLWRIKAEEGESRIINLQSAVIGRSKHGLFSRPILCCLYFIFRRLMLSSPLLQIAHFFTICLFLVLTEREEREDRHPCSQVLLFLPDSPASFPLHRSLIAFLIAPRLAAVVIECTPTPATVQMTLTNLNFANYPTFFSTFLSTFLCFLAPLASLCFPRDWAMFSISFVYCVAVSSFLTLCPFLFLVLLLSSRTHAALILGLHARIRVAYLPPSHHTYSSLGFYLCSPFSLLPPSRSPVHPIILRYGRQSRSTTHRH